MNKGPAACRRASRSIRHRYQFPKMFLDPFGNKGNAEPAFFVVVVGATITRELDRRAHLFENLEIVVEAALGDADLVSTVCRLAGGLEVD